MIRIGNYQFEGPYSSEKDLMDQSAVYAILDKQGARYKVIDIGESSEVKSRIKSHDREDCWKRNANGTLCVAVFYTSNRFRIEEELRRLCTPVCGIR